MDVPLAASWIDLHAAPDPRPLLPGAPLPPLHPPQIKAYRKDIAELLRSGKQDYARIRVEAILRENAALQVRVLPVRAVI